MVSYCMFYFNISPPLGKDFFYLWILIVLKIYTPAKHITCECKMLKLCGQTVWFQNLVLPLIDYVTCEIIIEKQWLDTSNDVCSKIRKSYNAIKEHLYLSPFSNSSRIFCIQNILQRSSNLSYCPLVRQGDVILT